MNGSINVRETVAQKNVDPIPPQPSRMTIPQRWLSLAELAVGSGIVVGHNVYHVVPNEEPILFVLGLLSLRLRDGSWRATGLGWPISWRRTALFALAVAALRILLGALLIHPITAHFWPPAAAPSGSAEVTGHAVVALEWLLLTWTFAAFGEEIGYRGYLLRRGGSGGAIESRLLGRRFRRRRALWIRTLLQRSIWNRGFRHGWRASWGGLCVVGAQPVGLHFGPWIH
jgi:hypothetical protein